MLACRERPGYGPALLCGSTTEPPPIHSPRPDPLGPDARGRRDGASRWRRQERHRRPGSVQPPQKEPSESDLQNPLFGAVARVPETHPAAQVLCPHTTIRQLRPALHYRQFRNPCDAVVLPCRYSDFPFAGDGPALAPISRKAQTPTLDKTRRSLCPGTPSQCHREPLTSTQKWIRKPQLRCLPHELRPTRNHERCG